MSHAYRWQSRRLRARRQLQKSDDYHFHNHIRSGGGLFCWHTSRLRCVSSEAVRYGLVTQGELLISQERDVPVSASGSCEDKQVARNGTKFWRETPLLPACTFAPLLSAHPRGQPGRRMHAEPRPHVNPVTSRRTLVEVVKTSHVMQWCLFGNGMF